MGTTSPSLLGTLLVDGAQDRLEVFVFGSLWPFERLLLRTDLHANDEHPRPGVRQSELVRVQDFVRNRICSHPRLRVDDGRQGVQEPIEVASMCLEGQRLHVFENEGPW